MKKLSLIFLAMLFVLTGCFKDTMTTIYSDDEKIASGENTYNLNSVKTQQIYIQKFVGDIEFEGIDTIWKYQAEKNDEIDISYSLTVNQGTAKLVLVQPDKTIVEIAEATTESGAKELHASSLSVKKGENLIKLVAKDKAQISFEIIIAEGNFSELGLQSNEQTTQ